MSAYGAMGPSMIAFLEDVYVYRNFTRGRRRPASLKCGSSRSYITHGTRHGIRTMVDGRVFLFGHAPECCMRGYHCRVPKSCSPAGSNDRTLNFLVVARQPNTNTNPNFAPHAALQAASRHLGALGHHLPRRGTLTSKVSRRGTAIKGYHQGSV